MALMLHDETLATFPPSAATVATVMLPLLRIAATATIAAKSVPTVVTLVWQEELLH